MADFSKQITTALRLVNKYKYDEGHAKLVSHTLTPNAIRSRPPSKVTTEVNISCVKFPIAKDDIETFDMSLIEKNSAKLLVAPDGQIVTTKSEFLLWQWDIQQLRSWRVVSLKELNPDGKRVIIYICIIVKGAN